MDKSQLEAVLLEVDAALAGAFPTSSPIKALVVGGACLVFCGVTSRQTNDIDCIIFDLMGSDEASLIFKTPLATKIRKVIMSIGSKHGFKGEKRMVVNDDCAPFLLELSSNELPNMRLFRAYQKIYLYVPDDLHYILACKLMAGRADKDFSDIAALCTLLTIHTRVQAQQAVDRFFPSSVHQRSHLLPETLDKLFEQ